MMFAPRSRLPSTLGTLVFILWGMIVWGLQFTAVYVVHTWLCALGTSLVSTAAVSAVLTVLAMALILPVAAAPARAARLVGLRGNEEDDAHLVVIARTVALLSLVAALWTGGTAAIVESCVLGR